MAGIVVQTLAARQPQRDGRHEGFEGLEGVGDRRGLAEYDGVDADQQLRVLVGGAPEHHAVDMGKMRDRGLKIGDAAIDDDRPVADARP